VIDSRNAILRAVRRSEPEVAPVDEADAARRAVQPLRYADRAAHFAAMLEQAGGRCRRVPDRAGLARALTETSEVSEARVLANALPSLDTSALGAPGAVWIDPDAVERPHELARVEVALLPGCFGVAENGAVWVEANGIGRRALHFLAQHVLIALPTAELLDTLHDAYARLEFRGRGFGCFVAGPSKTADIEQALVIGAHGPRSLGVVLVGA